MAKDTKNPLPPPPAGGLPKKPQLPQLPKFQKPKFNIPFNTAFRNQNRGSGGK